MCSEMGRSLKANVRAVTLSPSMAAMERFQDEYVSTFSVTKNRNQIQTSLDRKRECSRRTLGK